MNIKKSLPVIRYVFLTLFLIFFLPLSVRAAGNTFTASVRGTLKYDEAYKVLEYTNKLRRDAGAKPLKMDADLLNAAMLRAAETALIFDHIRPDGRDCFSASSKMFGENIAAGQTSASSVTNSWKNSSGHYRNMVDPDFSSIGIGCFYFNGRYYWVQCFGTGQLRTASKPSNITKTVPVQVHLGWLSSGYSIGADGYRSTLKKGDTVTMKLYFNGVSSLTPALLSWNNFKLTSNRPSVAAVSDNGRITAKSAGKATITLQHKEIPTLKGTFPITVSDAARRSVVFHANGGSLSKTASVKTQKKSVTYRKKYGTLPTPVRKGYSFTGWYTQKSGGSKITSSKTVTISKGKTQTLYAHWKKITVKTPSVTKLSTQKGSAVSVGWKKISGVSGYEIAYSQSKKFPSSATQKCFITKSSVSSAKLTGFTKGKTYYFRVRAYKKDALGNRIYGKYSSVKSLKIK